MHHPRAAECANQIMDRGGHDRDGMFVLVSLPFRHCVSFMCYQGDEETEWNVSGLIYLIQDDKQLVAMAESPYDSEDLLQTLLADYPNLLAGDQMNTANPRRWLLIQREMALPSSEGGSGRWSVDHLFLDQDGIPTIIEVKRGTDTRIRREVVGQMLEYAANGVAYWPVEGMQAQFKANCQQRGLDPDQQLGEFLGSDTDPNAFWQTVKTNLQAGKVRMVFVGDVIPSELRRIVEFLNVQMSPAEVLAVEIKQYTGQGQQALVPRVIGQTEQAVRNKSVVSRETRPWDEKLFLKEMTENHGPAHAIIAGELLKWASDHSLSIAWGQGRVHGSFTPMVVHGDARHHTFGVSTDGYLSILFLYLRNREPFDNEMKRLELLQRVNAIPGVDISTERISGYATLPISALEDEASLEQFLNAMQWLIGEIRRS